MKILWIINMLLPDCAKELGLTTSSSGGWLIDLSNRLSELNNVELHIVTCAKVNKPINRVVKNIFWHIIPGGGKELLIGSKKVERLCKIIYDSVRPDIVHLHGTEYSLSKYFVDIAPESKLLLTIQGIIVEISKNYYGSMSFFQRLSCFKLRFILKGRSFFIQQKLFEKNSKREKYVIRKVKFVTGRTSWDKAYLLSINKNITYFRHNYNLRQEFYDAVGTWCVSESNLQFISTAGNYPLKGIDVQIKAVSLLKERYPDIKLVIPGCPLDSNNELVCNTPYLYYLKKLVKKLKLENNIIFHKKEGASGIISLLQQSAGCIVSSAVEGASATACEAMIVGCPLICSYRGGMTDLISDGYSGYFYNFFDHYFLAYRMEKLINDSKLSISFSEKSIKEAINRHNRENNLSELINIYDSILRNSDGN